jgi:hypothetical protein
MNMALKRNFNNNTMIMITTMATTTYRSVLNTMSSIVPNTINRQSLIIRILFFFQNSFVYNERYEIPDDDKNTNWNV